MSKQTTVLMILDGYGVTGEENGNAIKVANTPNLDSLFKKYPYTTGNASGLEVGLPEGQMGNSEVGHLNIGAGRIVYQELTKISKSIVDGDFFDNDAFLSAVENCKTNNSALHLFGLLSDGGVHSHTSHLYALIELAKKNGLKEVYVHAFLDGRDTPPTSGKYFVENLEKKMDEIGVGKVASVIGRYYAMDRDNRWERVEEAYNTMVYGEGETSESAVGCIEKSYAEKVNDEFVKPTTIVKAGKPVGTINVNDSCIFFNYRPDRAREISRTLCDPSFDGFVRKNGHFPLTFVCMTEIDVTIPNKVVAFKPTSLTNTLGEYISSLGMKQLRIAETEKYAHVTFFFNGGVEAPCEGEDRILVASPKVATYDLKPEMSAIEVTEKLVEQIKSEKYDLIICNYANCDMVGHTGFMNATTKAVETVDMCIGKVYDELVKVDGQMFLCADHGNADKLVDYDNGEPFTAHTTNPVPFAIINSKVAKGIKENGKLCDIAPTLLDMMNVKKPAEMDGESLMIK